MNSNSDSNTRDIKTLFSLFKKDLKLEFRYLSTILITIVFTALIVVLFNIDFPFSFFIFLFLFDSFFEVALTKWKLPYI